MKIDYRCRRDEQVRGNNEKVGSVFQFSFSISLGIIFQGIKRYFRVSVNHK